MTILTYILTILSYLILGAHFMRIGDYGFMALSVIIPLLLFKKDRTSVVIASLGLLLGTIEWIGTTYKLYQIRTAMNIPATRMVIIMGTVAIISYASSMLLIFGKIKEKYQQNETYIPKIITFISTIILIAIPHFIIDRPVLLFERFLSDFGVIQIFFLGLYAMFVTQQMLDKKRSSKWRRIIWMTFSIVFFTQLILGILGFEIFLMTGTLHLPIPAIILAGPLYRWELSFMVFLFIASLVLSGPAWCSHLCYFGVWDDVSSRAKSKPDIMKKYVWHIRIGLLLIVIATALILNILGVSPVNAAIVGGSFGIIGLFVILYFTRKKGFMTHCTLYCPIGTLAVLLGKLSPFRIKIDDKCTLCMQCHYTCRYNALNFEDIKNGKPNLNCTLCGDCISPCDHSSINYRFLRFRPETARTIFIITIVSIHTVFLAIGRI